MFSLGEGDGGTETQMSISYEMRLMLIHIDTCQCAVFWDICSEGCTISASFLMCLEEWVSSIKFKVANHSVHVKVIILKIK